MFKRIQLGVVAIVVILLVVVATRPDNFRVERSAVIAAPSEVVYAHLYDLHEWGDWNPFEKADPTVVKSYEGSSSGVGSSFHYVGDEIGEGRMTIVEATPNERVAVEARFIKPFEATNDIEFTLTPVAEGVSLSWSMRGKNNLLAKAIHLVVDIDEMIGGEFEKGLADIKRVSEEDARILSDAIRELPYADDAPTAPVKG